MGGRGGERAGGMVLGRSSGAASTFWLFVIVVQTEATTALHVLSF